MARTPSQLAAPSGARRQCLVESRIGTGLAVPARERSGHRSARALREKADPEPEAFPKPLIA